MDWARLPYFLAVAQTGSLRAAADRIGATHATVDRNLRALEEDYGVRLFDRSKVGLRLTAAGEVLLPMAEEAENAVTNARRKVQGLDDEPRGAVRLSMPAGFVPRRFAKIIVDFERLYPEIELRVTVTNKLEDINRSETDVSIRVAHQIDDDVVGRKVLQYAGNIFASQDYLDLNWANAGPGGEGLQWIGWGDSDPIPDWVKASPFPKARVRYTVRSPTMIGQLAAAGMGMSYLPYSARDWIPGLVEVPGCAPFLDRSIWLLLHSDLRRTTRVRVLVDFLAQEIQALRGVFLGPLG